MTSYETDVAKGEDAVHRRKHLYKAKHNNSSQEDRRKIFLADQKKYVFVFEYYYFCPEAIRLSCCSFPASNFVSSNFLGILLEREMAHLMQPEDFLKLKMRMMLKKWKLSHKR